MKRTPLIFAIVLAGAFVIPVAVLPYAFDAFRLPKELALRAEAVLLLAAFLGSVVTGSRPRMRADWWLLLPAGALLWMILTTLTSTNQLVSAWRLVPALATLIVFAATIHAARERSRFLLLLAVPLAAASLNALLDIVQELNLWMPFGVRPGVRHHLQCTALIGNPNEVGSFLAVASLGALAAAVADRRRRRGFAAVTALLIAGVVASQTLTAFLALAAAALALFAFVSWKMALRVALVTAAVALLLVVTVAPLRERTTRMLHWLHAGEYNALMTQRLTPFVAASLMVGDHPLTGVGPGAFAWNYYTYKLEAERHYPPLRQAHLRGTNFGEVHNDHLQVAAEGGLPGLALFAAMLGLLASISFRRPLTPRDDAPTEPRQFARLLALPLVVLWVVLALAQFPLETTAVRMLLVHFAALCVAWRPQ